METRTCEQCGGVMSGEQKVCPECLKRVALGETESAEGEATDSVAALLPEWARIFPNSAAKKSSRLEQSSAGQFGDYQLIEVIGRGAMGTVFKARHAPLNRMVAL